MLKVFKYKLCPNRKQRLALQRTLDVCRHAFNLSLEQRKMHRTGQFAQMRELTQLRAAYPEYKQVDVHVLENVIKKLQRSLENMWERGAGFPRLKQFHRYNSFQFNNTGFQLAGRYLQLSKIGNVKLRLSREIPEDAVIKTLSIKKTVSGWYACFAVEVPAQPLLKKSLSERTHKCSACGLVLHRDTAAAQGILGRMCPSDAKIGEVIPCLV